MVASSLWLNLDKLHDTAPLINTVTQVPQYRDVWTTETWIVWNLVSLETRELSHLHKYRSVCIIKVFNNNKGLSCTS